MAPHYASVGYIASTSLSPIYSSSSPLSCSDDMTSVITVLTAKHFDGKTFFG